MERIYKMSKPLDIDLGSSDLFLRSFESDGSFSCWVCGEEIPKSTECIALVAIGPVDLSMHDSCAVRLAALFEIFNIECEEQEDLAFPGEPLKLDVGPRIEKVADLELYQIFEMDGREVYIESFPTEKSVFIRAIEPGGTWSTAKYTITLFRKHSKRVDRMYEVVELGTDCSPLPITTPIPPEAIPEIGVDGEDMENQSFILATDVEKE